MKLSTRSTYGMRALVELALAAGRGPVSAARIASRQSLSLAYLEQLLHRLKRRGLVSSIRGPRGGYVLAKDPVRITMADVVRVLESGDGAANGGQGRASRRQARLPVHPRGGQARLPVHPKSGQAERITQAVWRCVHERLMESLDAVTLQDLCDEARSQEMDPLEHRYVFHI